MNFSNSDKSSGSLSVLSLFDGIACGRVALERAGIPVSRYVAYEIDKNAIKVATTNYPDIEEKGDVFEADYTDEKYDLLIGGSPCTNWSIAKAGHGRETDSSGIGFKLFMQYVRALESVKPKYFLYENNASMHDNIRNEITKKLGVEPVMIDSADFSAQHRKRLYWTNIPFIKEWEENDILFDSIMEKDGSFHFMDFSKYKDTIRISKDGMNISYDTSGKGYYSQTNRARNPHQKWNTLPAGTGKNSVWVGGTVLRHITAVEAERLQTLPDNYTSCLNSINERVKCCGNGWTIDVIVHILKGILDCTINN